MTTSFENRQVSFTVEGSRVVGDLYLPLVTTPVPAVVVAGSLTSVKEQMSARYAQALAERGVAALAIDYRHYGQSEGAPRQLEDPSKKAADLRAAASYLATVPGVRADRVSLLGICTSGGNVLEAAVGAPQIHAVATVAGWFIEPELAPMLYGGEDGVAALRRQGKAAAARFAANGESDEVAVYGMAGSGAAHAGDHMDYYVNPARGKLPAWRNALAVQSWDAWLGFNPVAAAPRVTANSLIIHSDDSAFPDQARKVHSLLGGNKQLHWMTGGHFEFYDNPAKIAEASDAIARFVRD